MNSKFANDLIDKLEKIRKNDCLSIRKFSAKLGISKDLYRLILSGQIRITDKTAGKIIAAYPELESDVYIFLKNFSIPSLGAAGSSEAPQTVQNRRESAWKKFARLLSFGRLFSKSQQ